MNTGDRVPDFTAIDQTGTEVTFDEVRGGSPAVIFFYPKAFTTGCTRESCHFRDLAGEFEEVGALRIGVSADDAAKLADFDSQNSLGYPLLSDPDRRIAKIFGVKRPGPILNKRQTFVVDGEGNLLATIASELNMEKHADEALEVLRSSLAA